ncbi:hypothetical protein Glove_365g247 [Diversispora epigaea]|uniref:Uncharacterized protein n=1 Tax=Diversispora epigaea TaxID=1348612 RepID=A0A397HBZ4_9GLOM|nr:hypothetical protein Glove_365g247 [Diversispora epigaea]
MGGVAPNFTCHQSPIIIGETGDIGDIVDIDETYNIGEIGETGEIINLIFDAVSSNLQQENENSNESSCVFYERNIRETSIPFFDDENTLIIQNLNNTKENNTTKEKKENIREHNVNGVMKNGQEDILKISLWRENFLEEVSGSNIKSKSIKQPTITSHFNNTNSLPTSKTNKINQAILKAWVCCGFPFHTIENPFIIDLFRIAIPGYKLPSRDTLSAILKAWVCCGFPFHTIENPFIIDLFRIAIPGYKLPSRDTLSGKLLDQETIRIEKKIETELEKEKYLTISKY